MKVRLVADKINRDHSTKWMYSIWWQNFSKHDKFQKQSETRLNSYPHIDVDSYRQDYKNTANDLLKSFNGAYNYTDSEFILEFESEEYFLEFKMTWS